MILIFPSDAAMTSFSDALATAQPGSTVVSVGRTGVARVTCSDEAAARTLAAIYGGA